MISLICSARSGSTNLSLYLSKIFNLKLETTPFLKEREIFSLENDVFYKILIHQQAKGYNSLFEFGEQIILKSDKVILLDRESKLEQSESLAFRKYMSKTFGDVIFPEKQPCGTHQGLGSTFWCCLPLIDGSCPPICRCLPLTTSLFNTLCR